MHCPEHLIAKGKHFQIWHHQSADVARKYVSLWEKINPLRYEVCVGRGPGQFWHINNDAIGWRLFRNARWWVTRLCWMRGHDWRETSGAHGPTVICHRCMKRRSQLERK